MESAKCIYQNSRKREKFFETLKKDKKVINIKAANCFKNEYMQIINAISANKLKNYNRLKNYFIIHHDITLLKNKKLFNYINTAYELKDNNQVKLAIKEKEKEILYITKDDISVIKQLKNLSKLFIIPELPGLNTNSELGVFKTFILEVKNKYLFIQYLYDEIIFYYYNKDTFEKKIIKLEEEIKEKLTKAFKEYDLSAFKTKEIKYIMKNIFISIKTEEVLKELVNDKIIMHLDEFDFADNYNTILENLGNENKENSKNSFIVHHNLFNLNIKHLNQYMEEINKLIKSIYLKKAHIFITIDYKQVYYITKDKKTLKQLKKIDGSYIDLKIDKIFIFQVEDEYLFAKNFTDELYNDIRLYYGNNSYTRYELSENDIKKIIEAFKEYNPKALKAYEENISILDRGVNIYRPEQNILRNSFQEILGNSEDDQESSASDSGIYATTISGNTTNDEELENADGFI